MGMAPPSRRLFSPNSLAYLLYTSGSTGEPKGITQSHRNVLHHIRNYTNSLHISARDCMSLLASYGFDAAVMDIFGALLNGATLLPFDIRKHDLKTLGEWITAQEVTIYHSTPTVFRHFLRALPKDYALAGLRSVVLGGEPLISQDFELFRKRFPTECLLVNGFGQTEYPFSLQYFADPKMEFAGRSIPIGYPLDETEVLLLNADGQPGQIVGEIAVRSPYLAHGYWRRPKLTAAAFVPDPETPGRMIYRTGDIGRLLPNGMIEFLGRRDFQIKIRGFRIEPGEIEAVLSSLPAVGQVAVIAREDGPGDKQLVAYVVAAPGEAPAEAAALRRSLSERLPDYMVPSAFVALEALPLTPNGKLDRRALPGPERGRSEGYRAPRTPQEEVLCGLFAEVLKLERVGIEDNFFALGGHSLIATRLVSRVRSTLGVELAIRTLFEAPTVAELVRHLHVGEALRAALVRQVRPQRLPLSYAQQRLWFLDRLEGPSATYNIPIALRLEGDLDAVALEAALADVVGRHESLRTIFPEEDGMAFQEILPAEQARPTLLSEVVAEAALASRLAEAAATAIDLSREIPLRAWLFCLESQRHVLLLVLHHIAGDGWSMGPLSQDLAQAYAARSSRGEAPVFAELPVQYADYTLWQRELLGEESDSESLLSKQLGFWRKALSGAPEELNLPADRARPAVMSYRGATVPLRLDAGLHGRLRELAQASGASLFMVLQAGLAALLSRLGGGEDIPIGTPIAGRSEGALENLVGFFVNTLVLRTDLSGDPSFRELLVRVRSFDLDAYEQQEVPFERVVEALQPARSLARHPLFQVMLVLQNAPGEELALPGLALCPEEVMLDVTKFDLTLSLGERLGPEGEPVGIEGGLEYRLDLFERETVEAIAARFMRLLGAAVATPDMPLHRLEILGPEERHMLLKEFNDTARPLPEATLPQLFEAQVERAPEAIALVFGEESLTYQELNARANRLAHHLIGLGVGPESLVGIALERSIEMVVALLGVLKAGGAYLPLDPDYPHARLAHMLGDAAPALVLSTKDLCDRLPQDLQVLSLDGLELRTALLQGPSHDPSDQDRITPLLPQHPAYVIYTSGSTGTPKGVVIEHRALSMFLQAMRPHLAFGSGDRHLAVTTVGFDISILELFLPLCHGAEVVLAGRHEARDPVSLSALLRSRLVNSLQATPSHWNLLVQHDPECLQNLRILVGGEALPVELARALHQWGSCVYNLYGPTEATIWASVYALTDPDVAESMAGVVSIGRPSGQLPDVCAGWKIRTGAGWGSW